MFHFINNAMKKLLKTIQTAAIASVAAVSFVAVSIPAQAADWTITQEATITTAKPALDQGKTTAVTNSVQALNATRLNQTEDSVAPSSSQSANITAETSFNLTQTGGTAGSEQTANFIEAQNIKGASGTEVSQTVTGATTAAKLDQDLTGLVGGNTQALNITKATGTINGLNQVVTESGTMTLDQDGTTSPNNTQVLNYVFGGTVGGGVVSDATKVDQQATLSGTVTLNQDATGGTNTQGVNFTETSATGTVVNLEQSTTASDDITVTQDMASSSGNRQFINGVDTTANAGGTITNLTQGFTASKDIASFQQTTASTGNLQAVNFTDSTADVSTLSQTVTASGTTQLIFNQTSGSDSIQAGNMARIDGTASDLANVTQTFTGSSLNNDITQSSGSDTKEQALNLIKLGAGTISDGSGPHQTFTVGGGTVDLLQQGSGSNNVQALNRIHQEDATAGLNALQTTNVSSATAFGMTQNQIGEQTGGSGGTQAANMIEIDGDSSALTNVAQTFTASTTANTLTQNSEASSLTQAANLIELGSGTISDATNTTLTGGPHQQFTATSGSVNMTQQGSGTNNVQALNRIHQTATTNTEALNAFQAIDVSAAATFVMSQAPIAGGDSATQAANMVEVSGAADLANVEQTFIGSNTNNDLTQDSVADNLKQAVNLIELGDGTISDASGPHQSVTLSGMTGTVNLLQEGSGSDNEQAVNSINQVGSTAALNAIQTIDVSSATEFGMSQTPAAAGTYGVQAANKVQISGDSSDLANVEQTFTGSGTDNDLTQNSAAHSLTQAVNLIDIGNGGISDTSGDHQTFDGNSGTVDLAQSGTGANKLQALNATVESDGGASDVTITQRYTADGTTYTMLQDGVSSSGQFGNYAGTRFSQARE